MEKEAFDMEKKTSFIMYGDYSKYVRYMTDEEAGKLIKAVFAYAYDKQRAEFEGIVGMAYDLFIDNIERDNEKFMNTCKARSAAGKKSAQLRKAKSNKTQQSTNKTQQSSTNSNKTSTKLTENENEIENEIEIENENENDSLSVSAGNGYSSAIASERVCVSKTNDDISKKDKSGLSTKQLESEFEELWNMYPHERRQGKKKAYAAYEKARKGGAAYERIKKGLSDYNKQIAYEKTEIRYVKLAETWFSGEHWQDEYNTGLDDNGVPKPQRRIVNGIDMTNIKQRGIVV